MKWLLIVFLHVLGVALLVFVGLQLNDTLDRYAGVSSVLSGAFGIYTLAFSLLYNRNPKFYSAVNRLLLLVQRDHTYWLIDIDFEIEPAGHDEKAALIDEIIARLRSGGLGRVCVRLQTANRLEFTIDDLIGLVIGLDGARLHVSLDRKLTVPVHAYGEYQRRLLAITEAIQSVVRPTQVRCSVQVSFREGRKNPFYGFFVGRIPAQLLEVFHVVFRIDPTSGCRVEASQDHVGVEANSLGVLFEGLTQVLSFRALPAVRGSE
jgi:hypothetical protein